MRIDCISNISETHAHDLSGKTVFVIDVLRATSVMVTALSGGAAGIVPVETVALAKQTARHDELLAGERQCKPIPGFHLGNSPGEYTKEIVSGRKIVMTTTNGTRGIQKALKGATVFAASLLNAEACAKAALKLNRDVVLLCSGTKDVFALEDGLCAGLIVHEIRKAAEAHVAVSDFAAAMADAYAYNANRLPEALLACDSGVRLTSLGLAEDVLFCARTNQFSLVPVYTNGEMKPYPAAAESTGCSKTG
ncbi:2-phosphosulfolactate phosphatase [Paenibacillus thermotolerans]|uniref:2-phosphosulfolactate phosphatase n=1 Tax=Paenibacillus thermotolerans TaxID=3027807 RepID=UPI002368213F|nr:MULTISPECIES: 2-phosphosulfolactate phosphatase [unclassified Paenibacillus]